MQNTIVLGKGLLIYFDDITIYRDIVIFKTNGLASGSIPIELFKHNLRIRFKDNNNSSKFYHILKVTID